MAITLGINIPSLRVQRELDKGTKVLSKTFERLSTGLRISRGSDDAAGLAISSTLSADARIYSQGVRNLNDGISILNIAQGALSALSTITQRQIELAEQAANGVYSSKQRQALDFEAKSLTIEYNRILYSSKFNGISIFSDTAVTTTLQGEIGTNGIYQIDLGENIRSVIGTGAFSLGTGGTAATDLEIIDFNGDGKNDLIRLIDTVSSGSVFIGNGSGGSTATYGFSPSTDPREMTIADFNNDGRLDIITADNATNTISVMLGNANGSLGARTNYATDAGVVSITSGDMNEDGNMDVLVSSSTTGNIYLLKGNGDGSFQSAISHNIGASIDQLELADFNGDGHLDVVSGRTLSNIAVTLGNGDGTFNAPTFYGALSNPANVATGDFNEDGNIDIITSERSSDAIGLYLGNGNGTFQAVRTFSVGDNPQDVDVADLNDDGYLDVLVVDRSSTTLSVLIGNGDGLFKSRVSYAGVGNNDEIAVGDYTGDGVDDVFIGGGASGRFYIGNSTTTLRVGYEDLTTASSARQALDVYKTQLQKISKEISAIGAFESRVNVGIRVLQTESFEYVAAAARILDANIAEESAQLLRANILQQSIGFVMRHSNSSAAIALQLLKA